MVRLSIIAVALSAVAMGEAFVVSPPGSLSFVGSRTRLQAGSGKDKDSGGGAALAKPKVNIGQKTALVTETKQKVQRKQRAKVDEPVNRREEDFQDAPMYKVMLLADDAYDSVHVVERMCAIMEDLDEDSAATVFQQAQQEGKAMCGKYPMEHAEMYKEQLIRSDPMIFSDLEEENE